MRRGTAGSFTLNTDIRVERPDRAMGAIDWITANFGLTVLTLLAVGLTAYLVYVMVHPERF